MPADRCEVLILGRTPFTEAWALQAEVARDVAEGVRLPTLLLLEHPHVYTFGRRGRAENLLWDEAELERRGVEVHWIDRGGDVTYHGPGQLVGYPILPLLPGGLQARSPGGYRRFPRANFTGYVRNLEKTIIKTLSGFGLVSGQIEGLTGVWVQPDVASRCRHCPPEARKMPSKIAAIGVKVDVRGVTRHGFALNVQTDPEYWEGIRGCGLDHPVINLNDLLRDPVPMEAVRAKFLEAFQEVFGYRAVLTEQAG